MCVPRNGRNEKYSRQHVLSPEARRPSVDVRRSTSPSRDRQLVTDADERGSRKSSRFLRRIPGMDPKSFASEVSTQRPAGDVVTFRAPQQTASWADRTYNSPRDRPDGLALPDHQPHWPGRHGHRLSGRRHELPPAGGAEVHRLGESALVAGVGTTRARSPRGERSRSPPHRHDLRNRRGHRLSFPSVAC